MGRLYGMDGIRPLSNTSCISRAFCIRHSLLRLLLRESGRLPCHIPYQIPCCHEYFQAWLLLQEWNCFGHIRNAHCTQSISDALLYEKSAFWIGCGYRNLPPFFLFAGTLIKGRFPMLFPVFVDFLVQLFFRLALLWNIDSAARFLKRYSHGYWDAGPAHIGAYRSSTNSYILFQSMHRSIFRSKWFLGTNAFMSTTATSLLWSSCLMIISSPTLFYHIYAKKPSFLGGAIRKYHQKFMNHSQSAVFVANTLWLEKLRWNPYLNKIAVLPHGRRL